MPKSQGQHLLDALSGEMYDSILRLAMRDRRRLAKAAHDVLRKRGIWTSHAIAPAVLMMIETAERFRLVDGQLVKVKAAKGGV